MGPDYLLHRRGVGLRGLLLGRALRYVRDLRAHDNAWAETVARTILDGFDKHYRIFGWVTRAAKVYFERGDWRAIARSQTQRIDFYDTRVNECVEKLRAELPPEALDEKTWGEVKLEYVALLTDHPQPELAETFFNTVSCRILNRSYFNNRFIFVRASVSTEHMDVEPPAYRCYYPRRDGLRVVLRQIIADFQFTAPFADLERDVRALIGCVRAQIPRPLLLEANHQIQVLSEAFFRGDTAFLVGKAVNGYSEYPFAVAVVRDQKGHLVVDAILLDPKQIGVLFSSSRAYFMVALDSPATYADFLAKMMPTKPKWELYTMLGFQKAGKSLFYRDFLHHLRHSSDELTLAPGTKGLVMIVFTLPSYPYVFKVIRDRPAPPKDTDRATVKAKYRLVKHHDRAGRMADTLEYSDVAFPKSRLAPALLDELQRLAPSLIELEDDRLIVKHLYIERRMVPLDIYLNTASDDQIDAVMKEYGDTIRDLSATNIFPGDLLLKNFGVTRYGRVVFYDYDEIEYLTDIHIRDLPTARDDGDELAGEPWFSVGPRDVFPEELGRFILPSEKIKSAFLAHHQELLAPTWWRAMQRRILDESVVRIPQYPPALRLEDQQRRPRPESHLTIDLLKGVIPD